MQKKPPMFQLCLAALGVVFGDISTSPLYAIRECFHHSNGLAVNEAHVFGILSAIFWTTIIIVTAKYLFFVMRADNEGEGGVMALMALAVGSVKSRNEKLLLVFAGLLGSALLYGDGMITPAISVLSALEGLSVLSPAWEAWVIPGTIGILFGIFAFQSRGSQKIGMVFGPIIVIWLITLLVLGLMSIVKTPHILLALNPYYAVKFLFENGRAVFPVLGSIFLVATGSEALYADMGHFGAKPIRFAWIYCVLPALIANYFGQGALLLRNPETLQNPFYSMAPSWALIPLIALATFATIIASQAVISGAYSLTRQAMQLGYLPRTSIKHTSAVESGQIYVSKINWMLLTATIWLVLEFKSSSALASAYGIAVSATMVLTTTLMYFVVKHLWKWPQWKIIPVILGIAIIELGFFYANSLKIVDGGWVPIAVAVFIFTIMTTWRQGRKLLMSQIISKTIPISDFFASLKGQKLASIPGYGVFMSGQMRSAPPALVQNVKFNKCIHEETIIMTVETANMPHVHATDRVTVTKISPKVHLVAAKFGFMDQPNVPNALEWAKNQGLPFEAEEASFYLGRETLILTDNHRMWRWRRYLFSFLSKNAERATIYFNIPSNRVIEIGMQLDF